MPCKGLNDLLVSTSLLIHDDHTGTDVNARIVFHVDADRGVHRVDDGHRDAALQ